MTHFRIARLVLGGSLTFALAALPATAQTELKGGAVTVSVPAGETTPAFSFTNKTGVPICDLVITRGAGAPKIKGGVADDPQHTDEDWDVDDDGNLALSTGPGNENSVNAAGEGGGGAALGHADNTTAAGDKIRLQEAGADTSNESKCVGANRNFQVTVSLDAAAGDGSTLKIQPTNVRDANIMAFVDGLLGRDEAWTLAADTTVNSRFAAFGVDAGIVHSISFQVREPDVLLLELETLPKGIVDLAAGTVYFDPPLDARKGVLIYGVLSDPGSLIVSAEGVRAVPVDAVPVEPVPVDSDRP